MTDPADWAYIRHLLAVRTGDRCEATGERNRPGLAFEVHHRRAKRLGGTSMGWSDWVGNLTYLTRAAHVLVHAHPAAAVACGYTVYDPALPWDTPITLWGGQKVMLGAADPLWIPTYQFGRTLPETVGST